MNFRCVMIAVAALAAPAAGASAQGYGYDAPPPPYVYAGASGPQSACDDQGFTIVGAHAGVTVLGFGLNGGARFSAPADCGGWGSGYAEQAGPQFAPRPYAPPPPPIGYAPPPPYAQEYGYQSYGYQGGGEEGYGYPAPPCGCGPQGW